MWQRFVTPEQLSILPVLTSARRLAKWPAAGKGFEIPEKAHATGSAWTEHCSLLQLVIDLPIYSVDDL
jgi:hypothetical protein